MTMTRAPRVDPRRTRDRLAARCLTCSTALATASTLALAACGPAAHAPPPAAPSAAPAAVPAIPPDTSLRAAFAAGSFTSPVGGRIVYRLLSPESAGDGRRFPLVVHFHGSGEIGDDNGAQLGAFTRSWAAPEVRRRFPAYVLAPQVPARSAGYHTGADGHAASRALPPLASALALVDSLRRALPIDSTRIYVVGFSMGGSTAWHAVLQRPATFAAAIVVAGVPPDRERAPTVPPVPLLLVHGTADTENAFAGTRAMHDALRRAGATGVELRAYPGLGHEVPLDMRTESWWRTWLFARHR